ncbi:ammonium transporter [Arthrobacter roseus]|uniref:ammonium transporter n=1 Tax=Arthrobacter roseus TaxID=136274 RepID=UPI0019635823|nr:ammonium transporter [Arthrobacter roseus]MBM7848859.1 Amt family ammonium transporter [Arthrobacter roseus]
MELSAGQVWMMASAAMVLLMTPGLAFFYGGMTRAKSALNMMMMCFMAAALTAVVWVLWGYSMTSSVGFAGIVGSPLTHAGLGDLVGGVELIGAGYSATFAIIAVALISGAIADRARFGAWCLFVPLWVTAVYCPLAYMVWGGGLLDEEGMIGSVVGEAIDFAGGTVVHISAGVSALVLAIILGKRHGFGSDPGHRPHNMPLVMVGAALLWFGWFGFNGGAAGSAEQAGLIWINTLAAPAAAMVGWLFTELIRTGRPTSFGAASGVVAGLVAITPACADVSPAGALGLGLVAGILASLAVGLKYKLGFDDSLDVVGVHLTAGIVGTLALGFIALPVDGEGGGLFYGGGAGQLIAQIVSVVLAVVLAGAVTTVLGLLIARTIGFRISSEHEISGIDRAEHAESAYVFGTTGAGTR